MSPRSTNRFRSRCWTCSTSSTEPPPGGKQKINADSARRTSPEICRICRLRSHRASPASAPDRNADYAARSEEHTSELQSLMRISYAVYCLKKTRYSYTIRLDAHRIQYITDQPPTIQSS